MVIAFNSNGICRKIKTQVKALTGLDICLALAGEGLLADSPLAGGPLASRLLLGSDRHSGPATSCRGAGSLEGGAAQEGHCSAGRGRNKHEGKQVGSKQEGNCISPVNLPDLLLLRSLPKPTVQRLARSGRGERETRSFAVGEP